MSKLSKPAGYKVKTATSTSTTPVKTAHRGATKVNIEELNQKQVFSKKTRVQQLEYDVAIRDLTISNLKTHVGYLTIIALISILFGFVVAIVSIVWG